MGHTARRSATIAVTISAVCLVSVTSAFAWVYTAIVDFHVTETAYTYGQYTKSSSGDSSVSYRWSDDPDHTTVISANNCPDLARLGQATISAHSTAFHGLAGGLSAGACFALRGRTAIGAGAMYNHDGVLRR